MSKINSVGTKESYWRKLIDQWQSCDLSQKAFCKSKGVSPSTFGYWKRKLEHTQVSEESIVFYPLTVAKPAVAEKVATTEGSGISLLLNNGKYRLEFNDDFSKGALEKILAVMEGI